MFSTDETVTSEDHRAQNLYCWTKSQVSIENSDFEMISGDASFRRYFRLTHSRGSFIAVDAPPKYENNLGFVAVAKALKHSGLIVPKVLAVDFEMGFLLLSDLGDQQLLTVLNEDNVDDWYQTAMQQLVLLQDTDEFPDYQLPSYDHKLLMEEMQFMPDWFLQEHLAITPSEQQQKMLNILFQRLAEIALSQPQVTTHCDYHSRNLMIMEEQKIALIDFQDAVIGAVSYDLISLIKDCYIKWPREKVEQWMRQYHSMLQQTKLKNLAPIDEFIFAADAMALQRHIKVVGIFARLYQRDGKAQYLNDIPLTMDYIVETCERYNEFREFGDWLKESIIPAFNEKQKYLKEQL